MKKTLVATALLAMVGVFGFRTEIQAGLFPTEMQKLQRSPEFLKWKQEQNCKKAAYEIDGFLAESGIKGVKVYFHPCESQS